MPVCQSTEIDIRLHTAAIIAIGVKSRWDDQSYNDKYSIGAWISVQICLINPMPIVLQSTSTCIAG